MVYLLFYVSPHEHWKIKWSWIVSWAGLYGIHPIAIDRDGLNRQSDHPPFNYRSIEEALTDHRFADHTWVWLDCAGTSYVDQYAHPKENVIYCIGDDLTGFQGISAPGPRVKLRPFNVEMSESAEYFAAMVAQAVLNDRAMYLAGRRRS